MRKPESGQDVRGRQRGNTLLLIVSVAIIGVLIAFLVLNFGQLYGVHKQTRNALDATTLQVAKDISSIVVDTPIGRFALSDDAPPNPNYTSAIEGQTSPMRNVPYPIIGINTFLANRRIAAIVAKQTNNDTLRYIIKHDLDIAEKASKQLREKIIACVNKTGVAYDKYGNQIDLYHNANEIYKSNGRVLGQGATYPENLTITLGYPKNATTNIPTPDGLDGDTQPGQTYVPDKDYAVGDLGKNVRFTATAEEPTLVDEAYFQPLTPDVMPILVRVEVDEKVTPMAKTKGSETKVLHSISTAQCTGSSSRLTSSGTLVIAFNGPIPQNAPAPLSFDSPKSIMNASMLDWKSTNPKSKYSGWNSTSDGKWFEVTDSAGTTKEGNFRDIKDRATDDPSVVLALMVNDWLRTIGVRPKVTGLVQALETKFNDVPQKTSWQSTGKFGWVQPVYAEARQTVPETTGILSVDTTGGMDARDQSNWENDPATYQRQQARMWGYIPAEEVLAGDAPLVQITEDGAVETIDGNPISDLNQLYNQIIGTNQYGWQTAGLASRLLSDAVSKKLGTPIVLGPDKPSDAAMKAIQEVMSEHPGIGSALLNGGYAMQVSLAMKKNMKALSAGGAKKINDKHYVLGGNDFYPPTRAATKDEILGHAASPTGQDVAAPIRDWCARPEKAKTSDMAVSKLVFYKRQQAPVIGNRQSLPGLFLPALAQNAQTPNGARYIFHLVDNPENKDDETKKGKNQGVKIDKVEISPYAGVPTVKGQSKYQNTAALLVKATNDPNQEVEWQVQARDQAANAFPDTFDKPNAAPNPNAAAVYFADSKVTNYHTSEYPHLAAEWALTCPIPVAKPTPPTPVPPAVVPPPPPPARYPPCGAYLGETLVYGWAWSFWGLQWALLGWQLNYACQPPVWIPHA